ncbi:putative enzyme related to lactoylglutathione lyase [Phyllobacterium ifriqiyense]|uniref:Enzyme related to lactoylglutathione lyase n=1 Tax=Phyllobacterium ifriqiyense TaxID=314238 RepID=A0ABU0S740_9HYPH|nr:VOC family protein [Phyllobacterium ifriqiyense]MDQ0996557.1 putative enzyme related to lactoylglutathione lyase [Phyllobacterium ifriqiyense]
MNFTDRYPIIITSQKEACRDFWIKHLGFVSGFDSTWFSWLSAEEGSASIAFMTPDHPSSPPGSESFSGTGICFELQVDDAQAAFEKISATGLKIEYPITDEPFGQRRFGFHDPSGLWIDVVEQIEAQAGFWDKYMIGSQG